MNSEFSKRAGHQLIKGETDLRVSKDAGVELVEELDDLGREIAELALEYAEAAGRKTVRKEDIHRAVRTAEI